MTIASRTPEGRPNHCPVCGHDLKLEPSDPPGDAPCPRCGHLVWFSREGDGGDFVAKLNEYSFSIEQWGDIIVVLDADRRSRVVLDFAGVSYLSSAAVGKLINLHKRMAYKRKLRVRNLHPDLRELFRICRLDGILEIED